MAFKVVVVDFEFIATTGERPVPVCMVAKELRTGQCWRLWRDQLGTAPPYPTGPDALIVSYYSSAESGCDRALGWPAPTYILDLFVEFRNHTNGRELPAGAGLIGALTYFGIDGIGAIEKEEICAALDRLEADVAAMRAAMSEASRIVLDGFELRTDASLTRYPDRYSDPRGRVMWDRVMGLIDRRQEARRATA